MVVAFIENVSVHSARRETAVAMFLLPAISQTARLSLITSSSFLTRDVFFSFYLGSFSLAFLNARKSLIDI